MTYAHGCVSLQKIVLFFQVQFLNHMKLSSYIGIVTRFIFILVKDIVSVEELVKANQFVYE